MYTGFSQEGVKVINIKHFIVFLNHNIQQIKTIFLNLKLVSPPPKKHSAEAEFCKHTENKEVTLTNIDSARISVYSQPN